MPLTMDIPRSSWPVERRLDYIDWRMLTVGTLRRADIERVFGVSQTQASADINEFVRRHPDALAYDKSAKQYVPAATRYRSVRGLDRQIVEALAVIASRGHDMAWS